MAVHILDCHFYYYKVPFYATNYLKLGIRNLIFFSVFLYHFFLPSSFVSVIDYMSG